MYIGWTSASRLGAFSRYLQVHFDNLTRVTAVQLEHPAYVASAVQQYQVHYSNDGINWVQGSTVSHDVTCWGLSLQPSPFILFHYP